MDKKIIIGAIVGVIIVGGVSFYAGTKIGGANDFPRNAEFSAQGQNGQAGGGQGTTGARTGQGGVGGMTSGEIISKDEQSITVKLPNGGSKIVFFSESTSVSKNTTTTNADLTVGENVMVNGSENSDGSVNAQSIQIGTGVQMFGGGQDN